MRYFLIVYDGKRGKVLHLDEYADLNRDEALRARFRMELDYRRHPGVEVVVLGAKSLDVLKKTHTRYWRPAVGEMGRAAHSLLEAAG